MKIAQKKILEAAFAMKGNFAPGIAPARKVFDGVEIAPFRGAARAAVSISADFELNWAFRSLPAAERDRLGVAERANVPCILDMLTEWSIPITWATVGHLFLRSCTREGTCAHAAMPRPPANERWEGDWYKHDPCTDVGTDPLWYAPDLVEQIVRAKVDHEVGSHTFSHIDFSARTSNTDLVRQEIEACVSAMNAVGLPLKSLVYPFNNMGHSYLDLLHGLGVIAVRHRDSAVRLSYPERTPAGVYKIYESMNLRSAKRYEYRDKVEIFLDRAAERTAAYHLWFHPSDPRDVFENEFRQILEIIARERASGTVWVATMGELASYCEARENLTLQATTEGATTTLSMTSTLKSNTYGTPIVTLTLPARAKPRAIARRFGHGTEDLKIDDVCVLRGDTLIIDVPAQSQTVTLRF
jgi:polysaccharide deacetylase